MEVHEKTIRRDLRLFKQIGFPVDEEPGPRGRKAWRMQGAPGFPEIGFRFDEALALYLGRRFLEPLAGTPVWEAAQSAFRKVRACLSRSSLAYLDKMLSSLHATGGGNDYSARGETIDALMQAIEDRKTCILLYQSLRATEPVEYEVSPYGLIYHRGSLYVVGYSRDHDELRHFKVDRIAEVVGGGFPFNYPENFSLAQHLAGSFGVYHSRGDVLVRIRFHASVARYVQEKTWHASQRLARQKDGSLLAEFRLSDTEEIKHWILGFGHKALVLEPEPLRQEMIEEAASMLTSYQTNHDSTGTQPTVHRKKRKL